VLWHGLHWLFVTNVWNPFFSEPNESGFIFAKAKRNPDVVRESLAHLRRYFEALFNEPRETNRKEK
jgi:hypothetical protein